MNEAEWQTRKKRIDTKLRSLNPAWQIILETRLTRERWQVDKLTPSLLVRAWTHSLPARSGCALSLLEILFTRSQRVQISGQLVPQDPTDEPASKLLRRIKSKGPVCAK